MYRNRVFAWVALFAAIFSGLILAIPAQAASSIWFCEQLYSNSDGSVQFVVFSSDGPGQQFLAGQTITTTNGTASNSYTFPSDLPADSANRRFLLATQGFADLGVIAPDYVVPNGFLFLPSGSITCVSNPYPGHAAVAYSSLPTDGANAYYPACDSGVPPPLGECVYPAVARNFVGQSYAFGSLTPLPPPPPPPPPPPHPPPPPNSIVPSIGHGLSGTWYQKETTGQGFGIEIYPNLVSSGTGLAQLAWFTFDYGIAGGAEKQRWYTASGSIEAAAGAPAASLAIYQNTGGNFAAAPITVAQQVGTATLGFTACETARFTYAFSDGSGRSGVIPLTRLTPNVTCSTATPSFTNAEFALSGNWYDPSTSGQGFFFEVNWKTPVFFFAWYTYAPAGQSLGAEGQRWYTGQTAYESGARTFTMPIYETTSGIFNTATPSEQVTVEVGRATVTFASCSNASFAYTFNAGSSAGRSGTIALQRVGPTPPGCVD